MKNTLTTLLFVLGFVTAFAQNPGWHELGAGANALNANDSILCMDRIFDYHGSKYLCVGGAFKNNNGYRYVALWDGIKWHEVGTANNSLNANGNILDVMIIDTNCIIAVGDFTNGQGNRYVAYWNGNYWSELGGQNSLKANNRINCIQKKGIKPNVSLNNLLVAGSFTLANGKQYIARYNGSNWDSLIVGFNGPIREIKNSNANSIMDIVAVGDFFNPLTPNYKQIGFGSLFSPSNTNVVFKSNFSYGTQYNSTIFTFDEYGGDFVCGGHFTNTNTFYDIHSYSGYSNFNLNGRIRACDAGAHIFAGNFTNNLGMHYVATCNYSFNPLSLTELGFNSMAPLNANGEILSLIVDSLSCLNSSGLIQAFAAGKFTNSQGKYYVAEYREGTFTPYINIVNVSSDTICQGTAVNFTCTATNAGSSPIYNWYKNNNLLGLNTTSISLSSLNNNDSVWCDVNPNTLCVSSNSVISNKVRITDYQIPLFQIQPQNVSATIGSTTYFKSSAINAAHYQWQVNNGTGYQNLMNAGSYNGTSTDSLIITNVNLGLSNNYYRCIATNGICSDTSNYAILTVSQGNGINQLHAEAINIYPNPASNQINIVSNAARYPVGYKILNELGQTILIGELKSNNTSQDISNLATGNYMLVVGTKHVTFVKNK